MRWESVQELKHSLRARTAVGAAEGMTHLHLAVAAGRPQAIAQAGPSIALGAAPGAAPGDYRLAVRVQRQDLLHGPELAEIVTEARGEVEVAFVGPGFKQAGTPEPRRRRPLEIGCSIGHPSITAGTLGCFIETAAGVRILSNNHVLADEDRAEAGDPILQPGSYDNGTAPADVIGALDHVIPLRVGSGNRMDAATAILADAIEFDAGNVPGLGRLVGDASITGTEPLAKVGRTSGLTRGRVVALDVDGLSLNYEKGPIQFDGVIEIAGISGQFTEGGDSGSLVVVDEASPRAVALHFGGLANGHSVAAPLPEVLQELQASLLS